MSFLLYNIPCMYFHTLVIRDSLVGQLGCMYVRLCIEKPTGLGYFSKSKIESQLNNWNGVLLSNLCRLGLSNNQSQ